MPKSISEKVLNMFKNITFGFQTLYLSFVIVASTAPNEFRDECLDAHNTYRKRHAAPFLEIDQNIQEIAQAYAKELATKHFKLIHSNSSFGENLFMSSGAKVDAKATVELWYEEVEKYNFDNPELSKGVVSHFTQIVWKDTKQFGCAYFRNRDNVYVVANYHPAGNIDGEFIENVLSSSDRIAWRQSYIITFVIAAYNFSIFVHYLT